MPTEFASGLLDAWAAAHAAPPLRRATILLATLADEPDAEGLPIGERDRRLLRLLGARRIEGLADCPVCGTIIEIGLGATDLLAEASPAPEISVELDGVACALRLPDTRDVAFAAVSADPSRMLAERCAGRVLIGNDAVQRVAEALLAADPLLDPEVEAVCPGCGQGTAVPFDVAAHVWSDLEVRAMRLMAEVDALARAYGWSEAEILALPPPRRTAYIALESA